MTVDQQILIVEDSEESILYISQILEEHGYTYVVARNGHEALERLDEWSPKLVLLDIMMPRKTGFGVYKKMKQNPALAEIPIIVVTGVSEVTGVDIKTGREEPKEDYGDDVTRRLGVTLRSKLQQIKPDGLLEKPIRPAALVNKLNELLN